MTRMLTSALTSNSTSTKSLLTILCLVASGILQVWDGQRVFDQSQQSNDLLSSSQYFWEPVPKAKVTIIPGGQVSIAPLQHQKQLPPKNDYNNNNNDNMMKNDREGVDLTIWTKTPLLRRPGSSPLIVTRVNSESKLQERLNVEFKVCDSNGPSTTTTTTTTTTTATPNTNNNNNNDNNLFSCSKPQQSAISSSSALMKQQLEYKKHLGTTLIIFQNQTTAGSQQRYQLPQHRSPPISLNQIEAVTYWSEPLGIHVWLDYYIPSKKQQQRRTIELSNCNGVRCPRYCPHYRNKSNNKNNSNLPPLLLHPYMWDHKDNLCKSSDPENVPPNRPYGGLCSCETTCFTPQSGNVHSTWPWKNQSQLELFHPPATPQEKRQRRSKQANCGKARSRETTSASFFDYKPRYACARNASSEDDELPCPIYGDFQHHLMFLPEAKLIFCGIPKVGITEWLKFFRYSYGAKDYLSLPHYKLDGSSFFFKYLTIEKAQELLNDPTWTRAVFFRDPAERLLSAYLNKVVGQAYTQKVFKIGSLKDVPKRVLNFTEFVDLVSMKNPTNCGDPRGMHACTDPHWKPQVMTCGLDFALPKFNFVASFARVAEHTKLLLERVGLWDEFGSTFDDGQDMELFQQKPKSCMVPPPVRLSHEKIPGFNQRGISGMGVRVHSTGSTSKLDQYYTPELLAKVREAYALDYTIWDELRKLPADKVATGRDLQSVTTFCAAKE